MTIVNFTPLSAFTGGLLIGFAVFLFFIFNGRIAGVSSIASETILKDQNRYDNLLFAEGGSRIIFSIDRTKEKEWHNYLKNIQINLPSNIYVKKIGYVSSETLKIKIQDENICNIWVEELTEKFNNSISSYLKK